MPDLIPAMSLEVRVTRRRGGLREETELCSSALEVGAGISPGDTREAAREETKQFGCVKLSKRRQIRAENICKELAWRCQLSSWE